VKLASGKQASKAMETEEEQEADLGANAQVCLQGMLSGQNPLCQQEGGRIPVWYPGWDKGYPACP
jgi:hypothetical protein